MNKLVISTMTCFLLLLIVDFNGITIGNYASAVIPNYNTNYKLFTGTVCNDRDDQIPFNLIFLSNGTDIVGFNLIPSFEQDKDELTCWTIPDFGAMIGNLVGTSGSDIMFGKDGADVLRGKEGDDILDGGNNDDVLFGDGGNDELFGSLGDDQMYGGNEDDVLDGLFGNDYLLGGNGKDELYGGQGNDVLKGGAGPDFFDCGDDVDIVLDYQVSEGDTVSENCENTKQLP